ncbi:class I SAM-dependent methyltransferase [Halomicroarcula sp. F28]|uniref:class I SAM-dependent methyltransferase n=1 Tax=Haloarcula salinisoli TaxID=2487746 RepID=UPI001C731CA3|nr:class I SAM-dependent methyltransferase [Halomicroarcula salinisoli]MBX0288135.1 class I SAM-dependent methyltransferase [Halomicroarcula salinisoli]
MPHADWAVQDGAVVERPRDIQQHPLLSAIYDRHDELIADHLPGGETLELAFGQHIHPQADVGTEAWRSNAVGVGRPAVLGDARSLPFDDGVFDAVIGRRFLHHVPDGDRADILQEAHRVLKPGGRVVLVEGTPGLYRRLTKRTAFSLGLLDEDNDRYGHLSEAAVTGLVSAQFEVRTKRTLGSPFILASIAESRLAASLFPLYERTQCIKWWTFIVGQKPEPPV